MGYPRGKERRMRRALIEWRDDWSLGIPQVDGEHRELARLFNRVAGLCADAGVELAVKGSKECEEIMDLLRELGEHVRSHFQNEEAIMRESGYPDLESHHYEHATLQAEYAELLRELDKKGVECLDAETLTSLKIWLISHIVNADNRFGEYYRGRSEAG